LWEINKSENERTQRAAYSKTKKDVILKEARGKEWKVVGNVPGNRHTYN